MKNQFKDDLSKDRVLEGEILPPEDLTLIPISSLRGLEVFRNGSWSPFHTEPPEEVFRVVVLDDWFPIGAEKRGDDTLPPEVAVCLHE